MTSMREGGGASVNLLYIIINMTRILNYIL